MNNWVNCKVFGFEQHGASDNREWVAGKNVLRKTRSRMTVVLCAMFLAYAVIIGRMTHLTVAQQLIERAEPDDFASGKAVTATAAIANAKRADVVDREGRLLATSLKTSSLYADPKLIADPQDAARKLMQVFPHLNYDDTVKKLSGKRRFVWIKRNLTPKQIYAANRLGIPGVDFIDETRRVYPYGALMAHAVGYTDVDGNGLSGIERAMDGALKGGQSVLQTTFDVRMQHILHREIQKSMKDFNAIGGAGMIMDAKNGEIYAMVSLPDFNPHQAGNITNDQRFNRITLGAYEMGSTFKAFTVAAGLEQLKLPLTKRYDATSSLYRAGFTIRDFRGEGRPLSIPEILIHSSNIGTALMAEQIGTDGLRSFYETLGFTKKPDIELKEVASPIIPRPWRPINTITASYGHGIAVTPVHVASGMAGLVNGGFKVKPTVIKRDQSSYLNDTPERIISADTSAKMRNLLRVVATDGSARRANAKGYRVGGKTGTAEKTLGRGYSRKAQISSLVSAFPMDDPRFIVMIMIDEPKGNKSSYGFATAGWVAAPYVGNVVRDIAPLAGIMPEHDLRLQPVRASLGLTPAAHAVSGTYTSRQQGGRLASY